MHRLENNMDIATRDRSENRAWHLRLDKAQTPQAVLDVAKEFLALFAVAEMAQVPEGSRPGLIDNPAQIAHYAVRLANASLIQGDKAGNGLHRLSAFFTKAALRIFEIDGRLDTQCDVDAVRL